MRQLARGMERMRWLLDNGVIPNIPDPLRLTVVDKHYRSWSMSLARKTYYKYAYFYDHVLPIELPTLSIVDFYQDQ